MSPLNPFEYAADLKGFMKVRLFYQTWEPKHVRSQVLRIDLRMNAPFVENISVLLPLPFISTDLSAYEEIFRSLQAAGYLSPTDKIRDFELRDEDVCTLALYRVSDLEERL